MYHGVRQLYGLKQIILVMIDKNYDRRTALTNDKNNRL